MKVLAVLGACFAQVLVERVAASGLFVEFNQDWAIDPRMFLLSNDAVSTNHSTVLLASDAFASDKEEFVVENPGVTPPWELGSGTTESTEEETVSLLSRELIAAPQPTTVPCSNTDSTPTAPTVRVLALITDCVIDDLPWIDAWIDNLASEDSRYFARGAASKIEYVKRYVPGCGYPLPGGRVRFDPNEAKPVNTIGAIGFVTGGYSYGLVTDYVNSKGINSLIGFQNANWIGSPGYNGFRFYSNAASLNAYNPYSVVRMLHCSGLPNAVPTSYVDAAGKRQCYCSCPSGYKLQNGQCVVVPDQTCFCAWDKAFDGFTFEIKEGENAKYEGAGGACLIKNLATIGLLPVPVAIDNYVAHDRVNDRDSANPADVTAPHLELQKKKQTVSVVQNSVTTVEQGDANGLTQSYTWKDFQRTSAAKVNAVELSRVGKYKLELKAKDFSSSEATCEACVLVVDSRRPTINPAYTCPADSQGDVTTALTSTNIGVVQTAVNKVTLVKSNALNDPCSPNQRCDVDTHKVKKFACTEYDSVVQSHTGIASVFSDAAVKADLTTTLSGTPFDASTTTGLHTSVRDLCSRCATVTTQLKEWWTPYKCASGAVTSACDGAAGASCNYEQCVKVNGKTIAQATASIKPTIKAKSKTVVSQLNNDALTDDATLTAKYALGTSVHVALECSAFLSAAPGRVLLGEDENAQISPDVCTYPSKVADLIDTAALAPPVAGVLFSTSEISPLVSWRYQIDGGVWSPLTAASETFWKPESVIVVEAWTKCGRVDKFTFKVILHLNNPIRVCDHFSKMWYQTTSPPLLLTPNSFCMFPKSDFAEVTFDYHPNIGLNFDPTQFQLSISRVECSMKYDGRDSVKVVDTGATAAQGETFEVVKQFAIDGVDIATTKESTKVSVSCDFTYIRPHDATKVVHNCPLDFVIKDCTPPLISKPCALDGKCNLNQCSIAGSGGPDLYQSCAGNRITQDTTGATKLTTAQVSCCASCDVSSFVPTCVPIQSFPIGAGSKFDQIKRCEAIPVAPILMASEVADEAQGYGTGVTAMMGATAMVAVVALVLVQRRRAAARKVTVEQDAYYPLME